jgi:hypothetical protein
VSFSAPCPGCLMGDHERHERDWGIKPGLIGGSSCDCVGDCAETFAAEGAAMAARLPLRPPHPATETDPMTCDHEAQIRDLLEEREELLTEIRRLRMGNHPAGRALPHLALAEALTERDAEHEGGEGA